MVTARVDDKAYVREKLGEFSESNPVVFVLAVVVVAVQSRHARAEEILYRAVVVLELKENMVVGYELLEFLGVFSCTVIFVQAVLRVLVRV